MTAAVWYRRIIIACAVFFALTIAAMIAYPGGRIGDAGSEGYAFFTNFFSDLGQTQTHSGAANHTSLVLFCLALAAVAFGMSAFFITFVGMFALAPAWTRSLTVAGAAAGCLSAIAFLGVAATPWNVYLLAHNAFVIWAFRLFLVAVLCDLAAIFGTRTVPRTFAVVFALFALVLIAYIVLLAAGPRLDTAGGALIQATGQKIIVYASVVTILVQSLLARRLTVR